MSKFAAFRAACSGGHVGVVSALLQIIGGADAEALSEGIIAASRAGQVAIITLLLNLPWETDACSAVIAALEEAASAGQMSSMLRLLADERAEISEYALVQAGCCGHVEILDRLMADPRSEIPHFPWVNLSCAPFANESAILRLLMADPRTPPSRACGSPLKTAIRRGDRALLEQLLADPRAEPGEEVLLQALKQPSMLDLVLDDGRAIRRRVLGSALRVAVEFGDEASVQRLLAFTLAAGHDRDGSSEELDPYDTDSDAEYVFGFDASAAMESACRAGNVAMVDLLLTHPRVRVDLRAGVRGSTWQLTSDRSSCGALSLAVAGGHLAVVQRLLCDPHGRFPPADGLEAAAEAGRLDVVELLLADPRCHMRSCLPVLSRALLRAITGDHAHVVRALLPRVMLGLDDATMPHTALCEAAQSNSTAALEALLEDGRFDPTGDGCEPLRIAVRMGHECIVRRLLHVPAVHAQAVLEAGWPLVEAAAGGHVAVVDLLLADARVDPAAREGEALLSACAKGHLEVARRLLAHPRVDPSLRDQEALFSALEARNEGIALRLLSHPRVDPTVRDGEAVALAARGRLWSVLRELLRYPRINAAVEHSVALVEAAAADQLDIVEELLSHAGIFAGAGNNEAIVAAADGGATSLVATLLARKGVDPSARKNKALVLAVKRAHVPVVRLLMADARVDPTKPDNEPLLAAAARGYSDIVAELLGHPSFQRCSDRGAIAGRALVSACLHGHAHTAEALLRISASPLSLAASSASPSDGSLSLRDALWEAALHGHVDVVRVLLADPRVDPRADDSAALREAAGCGHGLQAVELLLADGRADPAAKGCEALMRAIKAFDERSAMRLLADPRLPDLSTVPQQHFLVAAARRGLVNVVSQLLTDERASSSVAGDGSEALREAASLGYTDVVAALLSDAGVDVLSSGCLTAAVLAGHSSTVSCILALAGDRIDPAVELHAALSTGVPADLDTQYHYQRLAHHGKLFVASSAPEVDLLAPVAGHYRHAAIDAPEVDPHAVAHAGAIVRPRVPLYMRRLLRRSCPSIARRIDLNSLQPMAPAEVSDLAAAAWERRKHAVMAWRIIRSRK